MQTLADIGEDALIRKLTKAMHHGADVIVGPGDDCAIVRAPKGGRRLVLKTDTVVEGVHFTAETPAKLVGRKAMARVISDFAAMAATPKHALVTLIAPGRTPVARVTGLYAGMKALARDFGVVIVGGETSSGSQLSLTISMTGEAGRRRQVLRSGGKAGDKLYVTGRLGGSIKSRHLRFVPRIAEAHWLAEHFSIHAMMDLSDGLAKDLPRMAAASGMGFRVEMAALPRNPGCDALAAWADGEDYELLFAAPARVHQRLSTEWRRRFPKLKLTCIGELTRKGQSTAAEGGWEHFR
jgi:thiamine-monophosphate kinase